MRLKRSAAAESLLRAPRLLRRCDDSTAEWPCGMAQVFRTTNLGAIMRLGVVEFWGQETTQNGFSWSVRRPTMFLTLIPCGVHKREGIIVSKEQRSKKETKKKPAMTPKEKKAAKKAKKNEKVRLGA